jgi:hypothetical protein
MGRFGRRRGEADAGAVYRPLLHLKPMIRQTTVVAEVAPHALDGHAVWLTPWLLLPGGGAEPGEQPADCHLGDTQFHDQVNKLVAANLHPASARRRGPTRGSRRLRPRHRERPAIWFRLQRPWRSRPTSWTADQRIHSRRGSSPGVVATAADASSLPELSDQKSGTPSVNYPSVMGHHSVSTRQVRTAPYHRSFWPNAPPNQGVSWQSSG